MQAVLDKERRGSAKLVCSIAEKLVHVDDDDLGDGAGALGALLRLEKPRLVGLGSDAAKRLAVLDHARIVHVPFKAAGHDSGRRDEERVDGAKVVHHNPAHVAGVLCNGHMLVEARRNAVVCPEPHGSELCRAAIAVAAVTAAATAAAPARLGQVKKDRAQGKALPRGVPAEASRYDLEPPLVGILELRDESVWLRCLLGEAVAEANERVVDARVVHAGRHRRRALVAARIRIGVLAARCLLLVACSSRLEEERHHRRLPCPVPALPMVACRASRREVMSVVTVAGLLGSHARSSTAPPPHTHTLSHTLSHTLGDVGCGFPSSLGAPTKPRTHMDMHKRKHRHKHSSRPLVSIGNPGPGARVGKCGVGEWGRGQRGREGDERKQAREVQTDGKAPRAKRAGVAGRGRGGT